MLLLAALIVTAISLGARSRAKREAQEREEVLVSGEYGDVPLEKNADPKVNRLFTDYYGAMAQGDVDRIEEISSRLGEEEKIRIRALADHIVYLEAFTSKLPNSGIKSVQLGGNTFEQGVLLVGDAIIIHIAGSSAEKNAELMTRHANLE